jgi:sulfate permease, SulP family
VVRAAGFLADLLSKSVLIGYLAGVAVTMIVSQLPNITGITSDSPNSTSR